MHFQKKKHLSKTAVFTFVFKKLRCYLNLREFEMGHQYAKECLSLQPKGTANWFFILETQVLLSLHQGDFNAAFLYYLLAIKHCRFQLIAKSSLEHWKIIEAYFSLLSKMKLLNSVRQGKSINSFRLSKFLNEVPILSKDKKGGNISILIVQALHLLEMGKMNEFEDRIYSLRTYSYRYLNEKHLERHHIFIKMLMILPKYNYRKKEISLHAKKNFQFLETEVDQSPFLLELIPYQILWPIVLSIYPRGL